MIIWLNGAFGSGKTQTAFELHRRISDSFVYDPENIGYFIRENIPQAMTKGDFQHYPMWRDFNYKTLKYISENYFGIIIVPMTLVDKNYYNEIIQRLLDEGVIVHHYILYAEKYTILKRLSKRFETKNSWAAQQIDRCMEAFNKEITDVKIKTDDKDIYEVMELIAATSKIVLEEDNRSKVKKVIDRLITQIKHIR